MNSGTLPVSASLIVVQCADITVMERIQGCTERLSPKAYVIPVKNAMECLRTLAEHTANLVLLYEQSSGHELAEIIEDIRLFQEIPIAVISPFSKDTSAVLRQGVSAFIKLPCEPEELEDSIHGLWKKIHRDAMQEKGIPFLSGELLINPQTHDAFLRGSPLQLGSAHFNILYALMRRSGTYVNRLVLAKEALGENWDGETEPSINALRVRVHELRRRLDDDDPQNPRWIEGGPGGKSRIRNRTRLGYRFVGPTLVSLAPTFFPTGHETLEQDIRVLTELPPDQLTPEVEQAYQRKLVLLLLRELHRQSKHGKTAAKLLQVFAEIVGIGPKLITLREAAQLGTPTGTLKSRIRRKHLRVRGKKEAPVRGGGVNLVAQKDILHLQSNPPKKGRRPGRKNRQKRNNA